MALTAGTPSLVNLSNQTVSLISTAASGGVGPYTQQWYSSTTGGFTPGAGSLISGATALTLSQTGLQSATPYYYKLIYIDTGNANTPITSAQLAVTTQGGQSLSQFGQSPLIGAVVEPYSTGTIPCIVDVSSAPLRPGMPVKLVPNTLQAVPAVAAVTAASDSVYGFVNLNMRNSTFVPGMALEISRKGNVMNLYATAAVTQGAQLQLDISTLGGVVTSVGSSGATYVGEAFDGSTGPGVIRVWIETPSFKTF